MLDIAFIRDNKEVVKKACKDKGLDVDIDKLVDLDEKRRQLIAEVEELRHSRNEFSSKTKGSKPSASDIAKGKKLKEDLGRVEEKLSNLEGEWEALLKRVPNLPLESVPLGKSEEDNIIAREWGSKPKFDFEPKSHWELAESRDLIDKARAAKVSGARFAYLKGGLVLLQFAIVQWVMDELTDQKTLDAIIKDNKLEGVSSTPFVPVLPPYMLHTDVFDAMDRLEPRDERYQVGEDKDDLWLEGSAEHVLGPMHMDEIISEDKLPIRYVGYATSFRREAGSYGKDLEGIIRLHQFDKLEMETISTPESGENEHKLMLAIQEYLMRQLGLPYRVVAKCTADIGKPNAAGTDIDVWLPGHGKYIETHTADYMTDYQARRLKTRLRRSDSSVELVHTNDATAFALGRIMVAIIENYQQQDGTVVVPSALHKYIKSPVI